MRALKIISTQKATMVTSNVSLLDIINFKFHRKLLPAFLSTKEKLTNFKHWAWPEGYGRSNLKNTKVEILCGGPCHTFCWGQFNTSTLESWFNLTSYRWFWRLNVQVYHWEKKWSVLLKYHNKGSIYAKLLTLTGFINEQLSS